MTKLIEKQRLDFLNNFDLPLDVIERLGKSIRSIKFKRGEKIVVQGEVCRSIHMVAKGIARAYKDEGKNENVYTFFKEYELFTAPSSFMYGVPSKLNIEAIENTEVYVLDWVDFNRIGRDHQAVLTQTYQILSERLMLQLAEKNRLLNLTATERYLYFLNEHPDLVHRVSLGQISAFLGMRQSSLSRVRRDIHRQFSTEN